MWTRMNMVKLHGIGYFKPLAKATLGTTTYFLLNGTVWEKTAGLPVIKNSYSGFEK